MTYIEARNSGYPFNRRKYKDGWYIRDLRKNVMTLKTIWGISWTLVIFELRSYRKAFWINRLHGVTIV
jgi:hypothetical protein